MAASADLQITGYDRRKSNRSAYLERSIFGTAIESLFGKDSIFSALDDPSRPTTNNNNHDEESKQST